MKKDLEKMKKLVSDLNRYSEEYYNGNNPSISDNTYDKLFEDLKNMEKEYNVILSNSPTVNVGRKVITSYEKVTHKYPMRSLDKTKDTKILIKFCNGKIVVLMNKMDGLTVELIYKEGILVNASTRGDGLVGEDITHNAKVFSNIPLKINIPGEVHIIGEAIIDFETFEKINRKQEKKYKNPRNLVSGTVKQLDSDICKSRNVKFIAYIIHNDINSKQEQLKYLEELGFETVPYRVIKDSNLIGDDIEEMKKVAENKEYPIDGMVITYDDITYGKSLGETAHHPLHSLAFKFNDDVEITTLTDVTYQVGRTGQVTPVAWFEPVELEGTTVQKASIHNIAILKELKLGIGDKISVFKANQIIPQIEDNLDKSDTLKLIDTCPVCGSKLIISKSDNSEFLFCNNSKCNAKIGRSLQHFCSKQAMNINGLSLKTINKFIDCGIIKNSFLDIFEIKNYKDQIINMEGFGQTSYNKLVEAIEDSKNCELYRFLFALGIPNVGKETSKDICSFFDNNFNKIINSDYETFIKINGIGEVVAKSIETFFTNSSKTREEALKLFSLLTIKTEEKVELNSDLKLNGLKIYCTGKFANYDKKQLEEIVTKNGGTYANGYSKKLDYLVIGSIKSSSKEKTAIKDGIAVLTEQQFTDIIK